MYDVVKYVILVFTELRSKTSRKKDVTFTRPVLYNIISCYSCLNQNIGTSP